MTFPDFCFYAIEAWMILVGAACIIALLKWWPL